MRNLLLARGVCGVAVLGAVTMLGAMGLAGFTNAALAQELFLRNNPAAEGNAVGGVSSGSSSGSSAVRGAPPPKLYMTPQGDAQRGTAASDRGVLYNAGNIATAPRGRSTPLSADARSARLKEIEDANIRRAHEESVQNNERVLASQKEWEAERERLTQEHIAQVEAQQAAASGGGASASGGGAAQGAAGAAPQARGGAGSGSAVPPVYVPKGGKGNSNTPGRVFNIFD